MLSNSVTCHRLVRNESLSIEMQNHVIESRVLYFIHIWTRLSFVPDNGFLQYLYGSNLSPQTALHWCMYHLLLTICLIHAICLHFLRVLYLTLLFLYFFGFD